MTNNFKLWWKKFVTFCRDVFHWFFPYHIFEEEPMEFNFVRIQKKERYDIKKHFLSFSIKSKDDVFKYGFFIMIIAFFFLMPYLSRNVGISTREWDQNEYSEAVYKYYHDGDPSFRQMPQYVTKGQLADIVLVSVTKSLGFNNIFRFKHRLSALLGACLIAVVGLFLAKIVCWRCAFFCSLFLFCTPRFLGYTFGNFNDTLFALAFYFTLIEIWLLCYDFPMIKWSRLVFICLGMLVATTTSLSGFSLVFFFALFVLIYFFFKNPMGKFFTRQYMASLLTLIIIVAGISLIVVVGNIVLSPGFRLSDLHHGDNFMQLFVATSQQMPQFFGGRIISLEQIADNYVIRFVFITIPFVLFVGLIFCIIFFKTFVKEFSLFTLFVILYTTIYMIWAFSSKYVGADIICSIIFLLMPLVVMLSSLGYEAVLRKVDDRYTNAVIVGLALFLTCLPLRHIIFNRPLTLCYFNEISGGIHNAASRYALDVNGQSTKVAEQWFSDYYAHEKDSLSQEEKNHRDTLLVQKDETMFVELDSLFYDMHLDTISVYTNGNKAFCQILQDNNPDIKVVEAEIHSIAELPGDYYILFGNETRLFNQTDHAFHTIDLERIPIVSFFKKDDIGNKIRYNTSLNHNEKIIQNK